MEQTGKMVPAAQAAEVAAIATQIGPSQLLSHTRPNAQIAARAGRPSALRDPCSSVRARRVFADAAPPGPRNAHPEHTRRHTEIGTICTLYRAVGGVERCPGESCPLWSTAEGACVLARLEGELLTEAELARHLLALRAELEAARDAERRDARSLFFRRLNRGATAPDDTGLTAPTGGTR